MNIGSTHAVVGCFTLAALLWAPAAMADYRLECASRDGHYHMCRLQESGYVRLERQLSRGDCRHGRDWGSNGHEIWVNNGCRAEFSVQTFSGYRYSGRPYDAQRHDERSSDHDKKVAAGVLVGAALLGAVAAHQRNEDHRDAMPSSNASAPAWMVGTFDGYNPKYNADIRMTVDRNGRFTARTQGETITGWVRGNELYSGGIRFRVDPIRDGFTTSQEDDRDNVVFYHRAR